MWDSFSRFFLASPFPSLVIDRPPPQMSHFLGSLSYFDVVVRARSLQLPPLCEVITPISSFSVDSKPFQTSRSDAKSETEENQIQMIVYYYRSHSIMKKLRDSILKLSIIANWLSISREFSYWWSPIPRTLSEIPLSKMTILSWIWKRLCSLDIS